MKCTPACAPSTASDCSATSQNVRPKVYKLNLYRIEMETRDNIVECTLHYVNYLAEELRTAVRFLSVIEGVDEVLKA